MSRGKFVTLPRKRRCGWRRRKRKKKSVTLLRKRRYGRRRMRRRKSDAI